MARLSSLLFILLCPSLLTGQEISVPEYGFAFTLPKGWSAVELPPLPAGTLYGFREVDGIVGMIATIGVVDLPRTITARDSLTLARMGSVIEAPNGTRAFPQEEDLIMVAGQEARLIRSTLLLESGDEGVLFTILLPANGYAYIIHISAPMDIDLLQLASSKLFLAGFRFLGEVRRHGSPEELPMQEVVSENGKMRLMIPADWKIAELEGEAQMTVHDVGMDRLLMIGYSRDLHYSSVADPELVAMWRDIIGADAEILGDTIITVARRSALVVDAVDSTKQVRMRQIILLDGMGGEYTITIMTRNGIDPATDRTIDAALQSIRLPEIATMMPTE